jgi:hypothetical protein
MKRASHLRVVKNEDLSVQREAIKDYLSYDDLPPPPNPIHPMLYLVATTLTLLGVFFFLLSLIPEGP